MVWKTIVLPYKLYPHFRLPSGDKLRFVIIHKMQMERLELSRSNEHRILSPMCLPIPPYPRDRKTIAGFEPANRRVATYCLKPLGYIVNIVKWTL